MTDDLTDKQQRFVEEYLIDLNATQAAIRVDMSLPVCGSEKRYYVYLLADSRKDEIFYVGKGKGQRFKAHEREWRTARIVNATKCSRIDEIKADGSHVIAYRFCDNLSEMTAFAIERKVINAIGKDRLSNAALGQTHRNERDIEQAKLMLKRIKRFDDWVSEKPRTVYEQE